MLIFPSDIPVYVINLKRSRDRRQYMEELCARYQITAHFIEAVDGRLLSSAEISRCTDQEKARRCFGRELYHAEVGCALSHWHVYQKILTDGVPYALVLEDDAEFDEHLGMVVQAIRDVQRPWEIILLAYVGIQKEEVRERVVPLSVWHRTSLVDCYTLGHPVLLATGTHGYLISQQGARRVLEESDPLYQPFDYYTGDYRRNLLLVSPPVIWHHKIFASRSTIYMEGGKEVSSRKRKLRVFLKRWGICSPVLWNILLIGYCSATVFRDIENLAKLFFRQLRPLFLLRRDVNMYKG